jgi:hypothetical protein
LRDMFPPSLYLSLVLTCKHEEEARIFCMIYLLTCKHEEEQVDGGWLICVSFDVICVCVCDFASQEISLCDYLRAV